MPRDRKKKKANDGSAETSQPSNKGFLRERRSRRNKEEDGLELEEGISKKLMETRIDKNDKDFAGQSPQRTRRLPSTLSSPRPSPQTRTNTRPRRATKVATEVPENDQEGGVATIQEDDEDMKSQCALDTCLEGLTIVVTGVFQSVTREQIEGLITECGGRKTGSVSGKTNYLVAGHKLEDGREVTQGGKYRNAKERGIPVLTEEEFEQLIRDRSGVMDYQISNRENILQLVGGADGQEQKASLRKSLTVGEDGEVMLNTVMWTDLYRPETILDLVGNEGAINQLFEWLKDWDDVHVRGHKKPVATPRFSRNWADLPRPNAKAALVSGPPGVGKSSAARIICKHLGYQLLEFNASDCRSKLAIQGMVGTLSGNQSLDYWTDAGRKQKDELAGNTLIE